MTTLLERSFLPDLEVRGGDGRTIVGLAVPFDAPSPVVTFDGTPYVEVFSRGAFAKTITERGERVKFLAIHDRRSLPLGRALLLREDAAGLYTELRVSKTTVGDEILELVKDGALDALSIGFRPIRPGPQARINANDLVERVEVALDEISVVPFAAYDDARILALREGAVPTVSTTPRLDRWRRRAQAL